MDTAKSTTELNWTSQPEWGGGIGNTHRAAANGWKYCVDQPRKGSWSLRGWGPDDKFLYRDGIRTMKDARGTAQMHQDKLMADAKPTVILVDEGAAVLSQFSAVAAGAAKVAASLTKLREASLRAAEALSIRVRPVNVSLWLERRPCTCPTPTHRMSCGHGASPKVVSQ